LSPKGTGKGFFAGRQALDGPQAVEGSDAAQHPLFLEEGFLPGYKLWVGDIPGGTVRDATKFLMQALEEFAPDDVNVRVSAGAGAINWSVPMHWAVLTWVSRSRCMAAAAMLRQCCYNCTSRYSGTVVQKWPAVHYHCGSKGKGKHRALAALGY
jgi:hypothetical protein